MRAREGTGGGSVSSRGIVHVACSHGVSWNGGTSSRRLPLRAQPTAAATSTPASAAATVTLIPGNRVVSVRTAEQLDQDADHHDCEDVEPPPVRPRPETARRWTATAGTRSRSGSRTPARTWTPTVTPQGCAGIRTTPAASRKRADEAAVEHRSVAPWAVQRVLHAEDVADSVGRRQGHRARAQHRAVEQRDREHAPAHNAGMREAGRNLTGVEEPALRAAGPSEDDAKASKKAIAPRVKRTIPIERVGSFVGQRASGDALVHDGRLLEERCHGATVVPPGRSPSRTDPATNGVGPAPRKAGVEPLGGLRA